MQTNKWVKGDPITINKIQWDEEEYNNVVSVFKRDWFGPGFFVKEFEKQIANYLGVDYFQTTNSGSSALLLAMQALKHLGKIKQGDLFIHPICTFPTSCNPIIQSGCIPVFIDVVEGNYNIDKELVKQALIKYPEIKGAIIPHLLGNSYQVSEIKELLGPDRYLIEDCCDTLGSEYNSKKIGTIGNIGCTSFYGSHHITTAGVGGGLYTNDKEIFDIVKSMVYWGRSDKAFAERTDQPMDSYYNFKNRYFYETIGYDMQMTEVQAAFGLAQLQRIDHFNFGRREVFRKLDQFFSDYKQYFILPKNYSRSNPSWFGYPLTIKPEAPFNLKSLATYLIENKVEIRPLFTGKLTDHPAYKHVNYIIASDTKVAEYIGENSFFIPSYSGITNEMLKSMLDIFVEFFKEI